MDDEHTEFDAWAAELYSRDLTFWESVGGVCFIPLIILCALLWPFAWVINHIKNDL